MVKVLLFDLNETLMQIVSPNKIKTIPGVKKTLAALSPKYVCCVATNTANSRNQVTSALIQGEIKSYFQRIFTPDEIKAKKPSLHYYQKIVQQLQVKPHECVMIGNSLKNDVIPAIKVGMKGIWYLNKATKVQFNQEKKYWIVPRMEALPEVLSLMI
jgi:FMN phosphatase YigB (HAD superfamily)